MNRLRERNERRTEGRAGREPAAAVAFDEMWSYRGARHGDKREDCWVWTSVVREADGSRWVDFEVGDRSEGPFLRLYERLPEAGLYRSDAYQVYAGWFPPERHVVGKGGAVNWNEGLHSVWRWSAGASGQNPISTHIKNTVHHRSFTLSPASCIIISRNDIMA